MPITRTKLYQYTTFIFVCLFVQIMGTANAHADAVDDAFRQGNAAAKAKDWQTAIAHYQQAEQLLPTQSALISYNLGTCYAQLEKPGYAVYYLSRALLPELQASAEIGEDARHNLSLLRQRIEIVAEAEGLQVSSSVSGLDVLATALRAPIVGLIAMICGYLALVGYIFFFWWKKRSTGVSNSLLGIGLVSYLVLGLLHGFAVRAELQMPQAIALENIIEVREGPGLHRKLSFKLQGGSQVRIIQRGHGWSRIRLQGGLEGWVPDSTLGQIRAASLPDLEDGSESANSAYQG